MKSKKNLIVVYIMPVCLLLWFIMSYGVNVPYWDQWDLVSLFRKYDAGHFSFLELFAQHNEHRIFFPKIIFNILAFVTKWNIKAELYFSACLIVLNAVFIYKLSKFNGKKNVMLFHVVNIISFILICSLAQYENLIWGFQLAWFLINTLIVFSVYTIFCLRSWSANLRQAVASLSCLVASFSSAYGLMSWIAIIPVLLSIENRTRPRVMRVLISIFLFLSSCIVYSIGYQRPGYHPSPLYFLKYPLDTVVYILVIIGAPVGHSIITAVIVGAMILISFLFYNIHIMKNLQSPFARESAPWLSIGWFAILTLLLITIGRVGFGTASAMSSRYTTVITLLIISCLQMYRLWINYFWSWQTKDFYQVAEIVSISCLFVILFVAKSVDSISKGYNLMIDRMQAKTCLEVVYFLDQSADTSSDSCLRLLYPIPSVVRTSAVELEALGWRTFPKALAFIENPVKGHGFLDVPPTIDQPLRQSKRDQIELRGWAILPDSHQLPTMVFLSYGEQFSFFAQGPVAFDRPDVAKALHSRRYTTVGWQVIASLDALPLGETVIKAWVYDRESKRFVKLHGEPKIQVVE